MRRYLILIVLSVILISGIASSSLSADRWAVIIGISKYQDQNIPSTFCANDAKALYEVLVGKAGFIPDKNIKLLLNEEATRENIEETMEGWLAQKAKESDLVIISYGGHGFPLLDADGDEKARDPDDQYDEYLSTYNMSLENPTRAIPDDIFGYMLRKIRSKKVLIFINSCYSGGAAQSLSLPIGGALAATPEEIGQGVVSDLERDGTFILSASKDDEPAWQSYKLRDGEGGTVFGHYLVEALDGGADAEGNIDGKVTIREIKDYVFKYVPRYFDKDPMVKQQTPTYNDKLEGDVVLIPPARAEGQIVGVLSNKEIIINLGSDDELEEGEEYAILSPEGEIAKLIRISKVWEARSQAEVVEDILPEVKLEEGLKIRRGWPEEVVATQPEPETGDLMIESIPLKAEIYLNGEFKGETPLKLEGLKIGTIKLKITKEGYRDWEGEVEIVANETVTINYTLELSISPNSISNIQLSPSSPASLALNQRVNITFDYVTDEVDGVRIFVRPFSNGSLTPHYGAHGSGLYPLGSGSGTGFFTIRSGDATVDQLRFQMLNADQSQLLLEFFIPVEYHFSSN